MKFYFFDWIRYFKKRLGVGNMAKKKEEEKPVPMSLREYLELLKKSGYKEVSIDGLLKLVYTDDKTEFTENTPEQAEPASPVQEEKYFEQELAQAVNQNARVEQTTQQPQPKSYPMPAWAVGQTRRASGLVEDMCSHGVGHPNPESVKDLEARGLRGFDLHGCCGCCSGRRNEK